MDLHPIRLMNTWRSPGLSLAAESRLECDIRSLRSMNKDELLAEAERLMRFNRHLGQTLDAASIRIAELEARQALAAPTAVPLWRRLWR